MEKEAGGLSFLSVLLIVFIVLKLCGVIAWSWFWVLSPFWIPCAFVASIWILCLVSKLFIK